MNELEATYVEIVEKYTLGGANTFTLMKHKHKVHMRMNDAITIIIM